MRGFPRLCRRRGNKRDRDRALRPPRHGRPLVPERGGASRPARREPGPYRRTHALSRTCGRRELHAYAALPLRQRGSRPHQRRSSRGLSPVVRRAGRRRMGGAARRRPGVLGRRRIPSPGQHRQPGRPGRPPERGEPDGPAHGPPHLVRGLGRAGVLRHAAPPRADAARTQRAVSGPESRSTKSGFPTRARPGNGMSTSPRATAAASGRSTWA